MKRLLALFVLVASGLSAADDQKETLAYNFEGNSHFQYFIYDPLKLSIGVDYFSKSVGGFRHYDINIEGECTILQFYQSSISKRKVVLDGSCQGQGSQIHRDIYEWDTKYENWCLRQQVSGEHSDRTSGSNEKVSIETVIGCIPLGSE